MGWPGACPQRLYRFGPDERMSVGCTGAIAGSGPDRPQDRATVASPRGTDGVGGGSEGSETAGCRLCRSVALVGGSWPVCIPAVRFVT